jgi:hypothetical protein
MKWPEKAILIVGALILALAYVIAPAAIDPAAAGKFVSQIAMNLLLPAWALMRVLYLLLRRKQPHTHRAP